MAFVVAGLMGAAWAQLPSSKVALRAQISPASLGATSGNDCWGYVSPSGREYALIGLSNQVAFVDITNPAAPVVVEQIPHPTSDWAGIKVYGHHAYVGSEAVGTGIQVIDMSQIDQGVVTLVRTLPSPGRSHTLAVDPIAGFLYACGSRDGTGTTMCFSLANPSNPVQVGLPSMTTNYQHEGVPVTYTSGPYAGRTIWYGFSESRGVDIYDFTNKNSPFLLKRATYPNIGYCHQGWLSDDKRYLFVDDEFDERNLNVTTRTLVFNVEDPANAFFVGTFGSGLAAIDHNQYVSDGFTFQANYRSGLRIFDVENALAPVEVGWLDTYINNNNAGFNGAWSNYPFFPSGTVIISDIERGLVIVDPSEAVTRTRIPTNFTTLVGTLESGGLAQLATANGAGLEITGGRPQAGAPREQIQVAVMGRAYDSKPQKIALTAVTIPGASGYTQRIDLMNWSTGQYELIDSRLLNGATNTVNITATGAPERFVEPTTLEIRARVRWVPNERARRKAVVLDQLVFKVTR